MAVTREQRWPFTPEQFGAFMANEAARWGKLIKEAGLKVQ